MKATDVRTQLGGGQLTVVGERSEQPRDDERRRVERQHIADRRQQERAGGEERPLADLGGVAAQHEAQCRAEPVFSLRVFSHDELDSRQPRGTKKRAITCVQVMAPVETAGMERYITCVR